MKKFICVTNLMHVMVVMVCVAFERCPMMNDLAHMELPRLMFWIGGLLAYVSEEVIKLK